VRLRYDVDRNVEARFVEGGGKAVTEGLTRSVGEQGTPGSRYDEDARRSDRVVDRIAEGIQCSVGEDYPRITEGIVKRTYSGHDSPAVNLLLIENRHVEDPLTLRLGVLSVNPLLVPSAIVVKRPHFLVTQLPADDHYVINLAAEISIHSGTGSDVPGSVFRTERTSGSDVVATSSPSRKARTWRFGSSNENAT